MPDQPLGHDGCFFTHSETAHLRPEDVPLHELLAATVMAATSPDAVAYQEAARDVRILLDRPDGILTSGAFPPGPDGRPLLPPVERIPLHFDLFAVLYRLQPGLKDGLRDRLPPGPGPRLRQEVLRMIQRHALCELIRVKSTLDRDLSLLGATALEDVARTYLKACLDELARCRSVGADTASDEDAAHPTGTGPATGTDAPNDNARGLPPASEELRRNLGRDVARTLARLDEAARAAGGARAMGWDLSPAALTALYNDPHRLSEVARCVDRVHHHFGRARAALSERARRHVPASIPAAGLTLGSDIEMAVPEELALLAHPDPDLRLLFYHRLASGTLMQYPDARRPGGPDGGARGDAVILVDESSSMGSGGSSSQPIWYAKAFAAAVRLTLQAEGRRVWIISFAARESDLLVLGDEAPTEAVFTWLGRALGGGTDYGPPLECAFALLHHDARASRRADLVLLSDGRFQCSEALADQTRAARDLLGLRLWAIRFGGDDFGALADLATDLSVAHSTAGGFAIEAFRPESETAGGRPA